MAIDRSLSLLVKFAGIDKLTGKMRSIGGASKKTAGAIADTRREIDRLQKAQAKIGAYRDVEKRFKESSRAIDEQRQKLAQLRAERDKAEGSTKRLDRSIGAAERKEAKLVERHEQHGVELQQLSRRLDAAGLDVADLARHEDRLGVQLYETNKRLQQQRQELERHGRVQARIDKVGAIGGRMQSIGAGAAIAGAAVTTPLGLAAKEAISFESGMADVRKVVDGLEEPRAFKAMGREILQLSRELPIAAEGLAQIVAAGGQAGLARSELLPFARDAARMGVAFDVSADQAGETMAKWRTAFRLGQKEVVTLADKVNYLSDKTAAAPDQISAIVTRVGPLGEVAGLAAGEIAAMGATLASMGVQEEIAATGIKNTMLALTKGDAATKSQKKAFGELGLEASAVAKSMQRDATGTIMNVMQRISQLPDYQRASLLDQLFGSESIGAIAPLLTQLPTLDKNLRMIGEGSGYAGSMMREFESRSATSAARLQRFNNRINALKIGIGERLLPTIERAAEWFGNLADRFSAWSDQHPQAANGLTLLTGAIGLLLGAVGILGLIGGPIATGIGWLMKLGGVLSFVLSPLRLLAHAAIWAIGALATFLGLPALLVGAIAVGLAAGAVLVWQNWDKIKGWFLQGVAFLEGLKMKFLTIGAQIMMGLVNGISSRFSALKEKVLGIATAVTGWFKNALGIRSPSRVFMGLGGHLTEGLARGVDRGAAEPLARMRRLAGQMSTAIAIGTAGASPAAAATAGKAGAGIVQNLNVSIVIHAQPGQDASDLANQVAQLLERKARTAAASAYGDDD